MAKWENETAKAEVIKSRHDMFSIVFTGFFVFLVLAFSITGCTYYSVEKLKTPVKYEDNHTRTYEREIDDR